jgi:hypothetical protein
MAMHKAISMQNYGGNRKDEQLLTFWTLSSILFLLKAMFWRLDSAPVLDKKPTLLGPNDRANRHFRTPEPTKGRIHK